MHHLFSQTLLLYVVAGFGVGGAVYLADAGGRKVECWLRLTAAVVFWPLFLPILLAPRRLPAREADSPTAPLPLSPDEMTAAIQQVDAELEAALSSLDGWAEDVL